MPLARKIDGDRDAAGLDYLKFQVLRGHRNRQAQSRAAISGNSYPCLPIFPNPASPKQPFPPRQFPGASPFHEVLSHFSTIKIK